ncbi:MAG TPA: YkgJ family cysteine cluster protein [Bryobacteraceae bacterium]|nr:YkgJ family cysteine cluster protein [Bryobacteraceae bacterium]
MIVDLVQIRRLGEQKFEENHKFRKYLKSRDHGDRRLRVVAQKVEEQIDCRQCGNCCREASAVVTARDVERLAKFIGMKPAQFLREYTDPSEEEGRVLKKTEAGCVFLVGNECSVYEARPHACEHFPHTVRGNGSIASRMWQFVDRTTYCPIVYNTIEAWKVETRFRG